MNNESPSPLGEPALSEAIAHLQAKWTSGACGACGHEQHIVQRVTSLVLSATAVVTPGRAPALPCIAVTCANCGLTSLVNAMLALAPEDTWGDGMGGLARSVPS